MTVDDLIRVLHAVPAEYRDGSVCIETDDSTRAVHCVIIDPLHLRSNTGGVVFLVPRESRLREETELFQVVRFAAPPPAPPVDDCPSCGGTGRVPVSLAGGKTTSCVDCLGTGIALPEVPEVPEVPEWLKNAV